MLRALPIGLAAAAVAVGLAWVAGADGVVVSGIPVLAACAALAVAIQWVAFVPAAALRTERFYDLVGAATYLTVIAVAVAFGAPGPRGLVAAGLVAVWAVRLGAYLARRGAVHGDRRFEEIKRSPGRFFVAWTLQGVWVTITALAALVVLVTPDQPPRLLVTDVVGVAVFVAGFAVEVVADAQKARFRAEPANAGRFITTGLWAWSRHPNYAGEITLWVGMLALASGALHGWGWLALLSPTFVVVLLTRVSGIPMLEASADARWGGDPAYVAWKARTPVLFPLGPRPRAG